MISIEIMCLSLLLSILCEEWHNRRVYQLLTDRFNNVETPMFDCKQLRSYCGGTHRGITEKLDYIESLGFNAIWISPFLEQTQEQNSYHGYWQRSLTNLNPHFGDLDDLKTLIHECH